MILIFRIAQHGMHYAFTRISARVVPGSAIKIDCNKNTLTRMQ